MNMINQEKSVSLAGEKTKKRKKNKKQEISNEIGWIPVYRLLKDFHRKVINDLATNIKMGFCNTVTYGLSCG